MASYHNIELSFLFGHRWRAHLRADFFIGVYHISIVLIIMWLDLQKNLVVFILAHLTHVLFTADIIFDFNFEADAVQFELDYAQSVFS